MAWYESLFLDFGKTWWRSSSIKKKDTLLAKVHFEHSKKALDGIWILIDLNWKPSPLDVVVEILKMRKMMGDLVDMKTSTSWWLFDDFFPSLMVYVENLGDSLSDLEEGIWWRRKGNDWSLQDSLLFFNMTASKSQSPFELSRLIFIEFH